MNLYYKHKKILMIAYHMPPLGGVPVMRSLRLLRYLPHHGWNPVMITTENAFDFVHGYDETLLNKIPTSSKIIRIKDPLGLFLKWFESAAGRHGLQVDRISKLVCFPDEKIFWGWKAYKTALNYSHEFKPDLIYATGFPWSSLLIGTWLKKALKKPLIIDLRDPWTLSPNPVWSKFPHHHKVERKIMQLADRVIFTSEGTTEEYRRLYPRLAEKMTCIPNGFDPEDFHPEQCTDHENHREKNQALRMIYAGSLGDAIPPGERTRTLVPLLRGLQAFKTKYRAAKTRVVLDVYSNEIPNTRQYATTLGLADVVQFLPRLSHQQIVARLFEADVGLVIIQGSEDGRQIVPAKLYEYIAAGLPVLALTPRPSEVDKIIQSYNLGHVFTRNENPNNVADTIHKLTNTRMKNAGLGAAKEIYNGINLVRKFATYIDELIEQTRHETVTS